MGAHAQQARAAAATSCPITRDLEVLKTLDTYGLQVRWRRTFGRTPPAHLTRSLLLRILAYRVQAEAFGDLEPATIRMLDRIARGPVLSPGSGLRTPPS